MNKEFPGHKGNPSAIIWRKNSALSLGKRICIFIYVERPKCSYRLKSLIMLQQNRLSLYGKLKVAQCGSFGPERRT